MKTKNLWQRLAGFFESGDLVPFAVITSIWHFVQTLIAYNEVWFVAIAQGVFVDMLHFRTVRMAVRNKSRTAALIAILTTVMSYAFHILFYAHDGLLLVDFLLAAPLPLGIPILAWQQEVKNEPAVKRLESSLNDSEALAARLESKVKHLESKAKELERAKKLHDKMISKMNPVAADVALMLATGELTGRQIAYKHGVSVGMVSGVKSKMNGAAK